MGTRTVSCLAVLLLCMPNPSHAADGSVHQSEISIGGVTVGETSAQVRKRLGKPLRESKDTDYLDLHYEYPSVRVSFSEGVVAGLQSRGTRGCTPKKLCPGDGMERMRSLYGSPVVADRETGRYYEYYAQDVYCWLQISADAGRVKQVAVACQP